MIVERFTVPIKPGKMEEAVNLLKDGRKNIWPEFSNCRIYSPNFSDNDTVVISSDFEDIVEHRDLWEIVGAKKEFDEFLQKWNEVVTGGGTHQIWNLE